MPMPSLIPIGYQGGEHLSAVGHHAGGLFLAFVARAHQDDQDPRDPTNPGYWLAILHTFDAAGVHLATSVRPVPRGRLGADAAAAYEAADAELAALIDTLPDRRKDVISVQPFSTTVAGFTVGLVADREARYAELVPAGIRFGEPWDGDYST
ncbi:hypothetical protein ACFQO7_33255 [Catellatospora aurea]|uniref:SAVED domain-containing protein n=1 Tax=Catellatospora aurea TaxID=1337874 RepID=A0ABW2H555_9ACTN